MDPVSVGVGVGISVSNNISILVPTVSLEPVGGNAINLHGYIIRTSIPLVYQRSRKLEVGRTSLLEHGM